MAAHTADHAASLARRLLSETDDEDAQLAYAAELCAHASSCCSAFWVDELARTPPVQPQSIASTLLDELLLLVIVASFAPPGLPMHEVLHCPAEHDEHPIRCSSAALPSQRIHQLLATCTWTAGAVWSAVRVVQLVKEPRVRQKALHLFLESTQRAATTLSNATTGPVNHFFDGAIDLVLIGAADLWSAIRKDSARAGARIAAYFPSPELIDVYVGKLIRKVSTASTPRGAWTEQEGALLAIHELLKSVTLERQDIRNGDKMTQSRVVDDIRGALADRERENSRTRFRVGHGLRLDRLPRNVVTSLKPALYRCLQHDQFTIRQTAAETLLEFASLCDASPRMSICQETISKLNRIPNKATESTTSMLLLGAFEAEGLLDVLAKIVATLPPDFLVKYWTIIFPTLERYVVHSASSVRQRSSAVILALATLSSRCGHKQCQSAASTASSEAALSLLVQMLLSLSAAKRDTERAWSWQMEEGRLLSVDVLVNLFGQDILRHECSSCRSTGGAERGGDKYRWAHDQLASATWTTNSDENSSCQPQHRCMPIIRRVDLWVAQHASERDIPRTGALFWREVCHGWVAQVEVGFASEQFELQRISKQVLPGLMHLCIWVEQTQVVQDAVFKKQPASPSAWAWLCVKYLLLHLRYLHECKAALVCSACSAVDPKLIKNEDIVWNTGVHLLWSDTTGADDAEVVVAKVEALAMMAAHFSAARKRLDTLLAILDAVLVHVHAALPSAFQVASITTRYTGVVWYSAALDRQFCASLTRMLPAMTARLIDHLASPSSSGVEEQSQHLTRRERWLALERTVLAWLCSDDPLRWLCVPKSTGRSQLVESLSLLVQSPPEAITRDEVRAEFDRIVRTSSLLVADQPGIAFQVTIADMLLPMWTRWSGEIDLPASEFVVVVAGIHASAQSAASLKKASPPSADGGASESWDDWDDDEAAVAGEGASADKEDDGGFSETLARLGGAAVTRLVAAARALLADVDLQDQQRQRVEQFLQRLQERLPAVSATGGER